MVESILPALGKATFETLYMVFIASFVSILIGLLLGSVLFMTSKHRGGFAKTTYKLLSFVVNITRSLPFIILMISILPFTRLVTGTTIGTNAAIIPLVIAAVAFFARICENALSEVSPGLIEAAHAMGASTWQIVIKVLLPESLPSLVRGATLTIIALIGYSAMAGATGGGGLGELAINYGYQRFNAIVMLETVIILIIMVQLIQWVGDRLAKRPQIKTFVLINVFIFILLLVAQFFTFDTQSRLLKVGVMSGWPETVMQTASKVAKEKYAFSIQVIPFTDYVQPNAALENHSIDANIFQHGPYLEAQRDAHHFHILAISKTFVYPMGFYSKKIMNIRELPANALIAIPNDPSNEARALLLLQKTGLIKLKNKVSALSDVADIIENPTHLKFKLLDAAQLPRVLKDADLVAITNDFIGPSGMTITDALLKEGSDSLYANLIVVREQDKNNALLKKLADVMHSPQVIKQTEQIFPNGAAVPAWH